MPQMMTHLLSVRSAFKRMQAKQALLVAHATLGSPTNRCKELAVCETPLITAVLDVSTCFWSPPLTRLFLGRAGSTTSAP